MQPGTHPCSHWQTMVNWTSVLFSVALLSISAKGTNFYCSRLVWTLFLAFTALHIFANYSAVRALSMETFNRSRLHITVQDFLHSNCTWVRGVQEVNLREPVFFSQFILISLWKFSCFIFQVAQMLLIVFSDGISETRRKLSLLLGTPLSSTISEWVLHVYSKTKMEIFHWFDPDPSKYS